MQFSARHICVISYGFLNKSSNFFLVYYKLEPPYTEDVSSVISFLKRNEIRFNKVLLIQLLLVCNDVLKTLN